MSDTTSTEDDDDDDISQGIDHENPHADEVDPDKGTTDDGTPSTTLPADSGHTARALPRSVTAAPSRS